MLSHNFLTALHLQSDPKEVPSRFLTVLLLYIRFLPDQIEGAEQSGNYETTSKCFMAISNGVADVCVVDLPTAQSAALTNDDLVIIQLDAADSFTGDDEMVNVCIATRKDDTALRDKIQDAMDAIGWNDKAKMDELMDTVLTQQPAAN